jgi:hypothetical protein
LGHDDDDDDDDGKDDFQTAAAGSAARVEERYTIIQALRGPVYSAFVLMMIMMITRITSRAMIVIVAKIAAKNDASKQKISLVIGR